MYHNHRSEPWNSVISKQLLKEPGESVYQLIITIPRKPLLGGGIVNSSKGSFGLGQRSVKSWTSSPSPNTSLRWAPPSTTWCRT